MYPKLAAAEATPASTASDRSRVAGRFDDSGVACLTMTEPFHRGHLCSRTRIAGTIAILPTSSSGSTSEDPVGGRGGTAERCSVIPLRRSRRAAAFAAGLRIRSFGLAA